LNYEHKLKKRPIKTHSRTALRNLSGMQCSGSAGQSHTRQTRPETLGSDCHSQKNQSCSSGIPSSPRKTRQTTANRGCRAVPEDIPRTQRHQRRALCRWARTGLVKKKDELGLKGPLVGHFKPVTKQAVVTIIKEAITYGVSQKRACEIFGIAPRKFRRWANPKPFKQRVAWNNLLDHERQAIEDAAWLPDLLGKPISHIFVHGHASGSFFASLSSVYRVLKRKNLVQPFVSRRKTTPYVSAHTLLDEGFSLLCYDGTLFKTTSGVSVWAIPIMLLPYRVCLHIGYSLHSVSSSDLTRAVQEAYAVIPEHLTGNILAHSDRGSAMKSTTTKKIIKDLLGAIVHFGRPHTPDDQAWIEAFIKTLKYHRDAPQSFSQVDDVVHWLHRFPDIYNNDPHSSLSYVTPLQALAGKKEVILKQRKQNLARARQLRYTSWQMSRQCITKVVLHAA
jgi:putative transposase